MRPGFCACVWTSSCHGDRCTSSSSNTIRSARFAVFAKFWQFFRLIKSTHLSNHSTNIYLSLRSPYEPNTSHDRVITRKSHVGSPSWHTVLVINLPFRSTSNIAGGTLLESINGRMTWCFILHLWLTDRRSLFEQTSIGPNINSKREFSSEQAVDLTGTHLSTAPPSTLSNSHTTGIPAVQHSALPSETFIHLSANRHTFRGIHSVFAYDKSRKDNSTMVLPEYDVLPSTWESQLMRLDHFMHAGKSSEESGSRTNKNTSQNYEEGTFQWLTRVFLSGVDVFIASRCSFSTRWNNNLVRGMLLFYFKVVA